MTREVAYKDQARHAQNRPYYYLGCFEYASARNNDTCSLQNLGTLLGLVQVEKVGLIPLS